LIDLGGPLIDLGGPLIDLGGPLIDLGGPFIVQDGTLIELGGPFRGFEDSLGALDVPSTAEACRSADIAASLGAFPRASHRVSRKSRLLGATILVRPVDFLLGYHRSCGDKGKRELRPASRRPARSRLSWLHDRRAHDRDRH
jgi:hypothetical protein